ncbi:MAG: 7-cyano-7-deazaguanine synthase QueC, partial [Candidatus Omnitrophota bacterium]
FRCFCLIFDYGQRHKKEITSAVKIARRAGVSYKVIKIALPWQGSALLDKRIKISRGKSGIPNTYVPGRNIIFLSFALSYAEAIAARAIFIGAHIQDYSGYPDCRPQFYRAFGRVISAGTKSGIEKKEIAIVTPLINKSKAGIIRLGEELGVPFALTSSCYEGGRRPCRRCDSCYYRVRGFKEAGMADPALKI